MNIWEIYGGRKKVFGVFKNNNMLLFWLLLLKTSLM